MRLSISEMRDISIPDASHPGWGIRDVVEMGGGDWQGCST